MTPESVEERTLSGARTHARPGLFDRTWASLGAFNWGTYGVVLGLALVWLFFNVGTQGLFLSPRNLSTLLVQGAVLSIVASGMVLIMVMGHIDLSVGSAVGLMATIAAWLQAISGWGTVPTLVVTFLAGLCIGLWQGSWVAYAGIPAFIVTLADSSLLRGITFLINGGQSLAPMSGSMQVIAGGFVGRVISLVLIVVATALYLIALLRSRDLLYREGRPARSRAVLIGVVPVLVVLAGIAYVSARYFGLPIPVLIAAGVVLVLSFVARRTRFGRHLYAIGGNRDAAILSGINISLHSLVMFAIMGLLYSLAGVVLASRLNGAPPDPALLLELDAITSAVIGGTSLFGGIGTVEGAILGALLLTSLSNGMDLMNLSTYTQLVVKGLVLLFAIWLDFSLKRRRRT